MKRAFSVVMWTAVFMAMLVMASPPAYAQFGGNTTTLSGLVVDTSGGVMPGVDVVIKNNATALTVNAVTDSVGRFSVPSLPPGTYTVTISLTGFKTTVLPDVQLVTATPGSVKAVLEIGKLEESVVVTGATEIVQAQSATVATTIVVQQIQQLPVITRTALDVVAGLQGVETSGTNFRGSTVNGLPVAAINITLDGVNVQDKRSNGEGFFMYIRPMMDSVEEITVSTSNPEAASTGQGGANVRMETRAGSNRFSGSVYDTWRNQAGTTTKDVLARKNHPIWIWRLNTPYWFNKRDYAKTAAGDYYINDVRLEEPGFRVGGPILKDKLFYFFNYQEFQYPATMARQWYLLNPNAQVGLFTYPAVDGSGNKTVDLLAIAAANSQTATLDPTLAKLLTDIRQASGTAGAVSTYSLNTDKFDNAPSATQLRRFPTLRLDYNLTSAHRITFSARYNEFRSMPDQLNTMETRWPGFPNFGGQNSDRYMWGITERSTLGKSLVNEVRFGVQDAFGGGTDFGAGVTPDQFNCSGVGCQSVGGFGWNLGFVSIEGNTLTGATARNSRSKGVAGQKSFEDTLTWLKGKHSVSLGGSWSQIKMRNDALVPTHASLSFGTSDRDTVAYSMLDPTFGGGANPYFPGGLSNTYAGYARNLYGFLTGRVTGFTGTYYLQPDGSYVLNGESTNETVASSFGIFGSDSWRVKSNLTMTLGLRWQVQLPMSTDGLYSRPQTWQMVYGVTGAGSGLYGSGNLYHPGVFQGTDPVVVKYENNRPAWNTQWGNLAPALGVAWRPNLKSSFLTKILSSDPVLRGGYSLSYTQFGTSFFDSNYAGNPGRSRAGSRTATSGTPLLGYDGWPVLLRDTSRVTPSTEPAPLVGTNWTLTPARNESLDIHFPDWPAPKVHQYSFGIQRELGKSMAIDVRYVGNTNVGSWTSWNMVSSAQWSMLKGENGFYDEFRLAQANLRANIIAGNGNTFAYTGAPGTSPLPIFMAYFQGIPLNDARNQNPANYATAAAANQCTASTPNYLACFKTSSWYNQLAMYSANLTGIAGTGTSGLQNGIGTGTGLDANRIAAGLPINFFMANPAVATGSAYLESNGGNTRYNGIQIELRRRMAQGLLVQANYTYSFARKGWTQRSLRENWFYIDSTGGPDHAFKFNWVFELPFGRGKPFGSGVSRLVDGFIGGWEVDGVGRIQSGAKFNYGGFRLVGMTEKDLQKMFKFYHVTDDSGKERIFMLPQDVIAQSMKAIYGYSATTTTGYANNDVPTGRYLAPASGPDCVQYWDGMCPGTSVARIIRGPLFWKVDMSFVKRIAIVKNMRIEARMDLYNFFNTINFTSTMNRGSSLLNWQVTSAAQDPNNSQDPGGRITQFGLRFTW